MTGVTAKTIAGSFALAAFAVAIAAGLAGGNPASAVLVRAIMAMVVCYPAGLAIGLIVQRVIREEVVAHAGRNPLPDTTALEDEASARPQEREDEVPVV